VHGNTDGNNVLQTMFFGILFYSFLHFDRDRFVLVPGFGTRVYQRNLSAIRKYVPLYTKRVVKSYTYANKHASRINIQNRRVIAADESLVPTYLHSRRAVYTVLLLH